MQEFVLDQRLAADTLPLAELKACKLLLMNDQRWPWLILVPRIAEAGEWHEVDHHDRLLIDEEVAIVSKNLKKETGAGKINIAMLGNIVSQLHIHVIARSPGDPNWPGPVWGFETRQPYSESRANSMIKNFVECMDNENQL